MCKQMCSDKITNLAKAMIGVQKVIRPALKNSYNGFTQSRYATLNSVMDACGEALINAGIWVTQYPVPVEGDGSQLGLATKLVHAESGEWQEPTIVMPLAKSDPQAYGSALTYARRYGLSAMVGLLAEDDDANMACQGSGAGTRNLTVPELQTARIADIKPRNESFVNNSSQNALHTALFLIFSCFLGLILDFYVVWLYTQLYKLKNEGCMKKHFYDSGTVLSAYQKIRNELLNELSLNKFKVGDSFYSENTLASRFEVARLTVRSALQTLEDDGYLYRRQGRGAFVASLPQKPQKVKITNHCAIGVLPGEQGLKDRILIMEFIQEFYEHAAKRGFMLYLGRNNVDSFIEAKVDGVVVLSTLDKKNITALKQADIPVVSLFGRNKGIFSDISNSPINTGEKVCKYLYGLGHQKIVFVAGGSIDAVKVERTYRAGALKAMAEIGIPANRYQALMGADCHNKLKKLLCSPNHGVDALFVHWESLLPVMNVLDSLSIKIPDDISVVSQGERILYTHTNPLITLVRPDLNAAAALALECFEQMMREPKGTNHEFDIKDKSYDLYIDERGSCRDRRRKTQNKIQQGRK